jgi:hypothetical protein
MAALAHKFARLIRALHGTLRLRQPLADPNWTRAGNFCCEFNVLLETASEPPRLRLAQVRSGRNGSWLSIKGTPVQVNCSGPERTGPEMLRVFGNYGLEVHKHLHATCGRHNCAGPVFPPCGSVSLSTARPRRSFRLRAQNAVNGRRACRPEGKPNLGRVYTIDLAS